MPNERAAIIARDTAELRAYSISQNFALVRTTGKFYWFSAQSRATDDGVTCLKPNRLADSRAGRWLQIEDRGQSQSGSAEPSFRAENKGLVTIKKGQPVAGHASGSGIVLASASMNGGYAIGVASEDIAVGESGPVSDYGDLSLSDWTDATGSPTLAAKGTYFLSATAGRLCLTPPVTEGAISQIVLREVAPDTASLRIDVPILL